MSQLRGLARGDASCEEDDLTAKRISQIWLHHTSHTPSAALAPRLASGSWTPLFA
jgi:hypothetical protein